MAIKTKEDKVDEYYELIAVVNRYRGRYPGLHDLSPSEALKVILRSMEEEINSKEQNPLLVVDPETGEVRNMSRIDIETTKDGVVFKNCRPISVSTEWATEEDVGVKVEELELKYDEPEEEDTDFDWDLESLAGIGIEEDI